MDTKATSDWWGLHHEATVVDLHAHPSLKVALFRRQLTKRVREATKNIFWPLAMRTNFAKLQEGGLDVLLSAVYIPEAPIMKQIPLLSLLRLVRPSVWRELVKPPYFQAANHVLDEMESQAAKCNRTLRPGDRPVKLATSVAELDAALEQGPEGPMVLVHTVEGAHHLQGEMSGKTIEEGGRGSEAEVEAEVMANLEALFGRGVASLTLAHFFPNRVVYPVFPFPEKLLSLARREFLKEHDPSQGLTPLGEKVVERMLDMGMIIDVSHCTPRARARVYELADAAGKVSRVIATHVGAYAINPSLYNLADWEIKWIADHGGVVGVIFMNYWLMPHETNLGLNFVSRTLEHFINAGGTENVAAFGSDFDGFTDPPDDLVDASQLGKLTQRLVAERTGPGGRRYSEQTIRGILGHNALRVLRSGWGKKV